MRLIKKIIHSFIVMMIVTIASSGISFAASPTVLPRALPKDKTEFDESMFNGEMNVTGNPKITFIKQDSSDISWENPICKQDGTLFGMKASFELNNIDEIIEGVSNGEIESIPEEIRPLISYFQDYALISGSFDLSIDLNEGLGEYFKVNQDVLNEIKQDPNSLFDGNKAYQDVFTIDKVTESSNIVNISVSMKPDITGKMILSLKNKFKTLDVTFKDLFELNPLLWDKVDQLNKGEFDKLVKITAPETIFVVKIPDWILSLAQMVIPGALKNPFVGVEIHMDPGYGKLNLGYLLIYDGNGNTSGTVPVDENNPYPEKVPVTVKDQQDLKKDKHTFVGWALKKDELNPIKIVNPGEQITLNKNIILYAQWKKDLVPQPVTIHYQDVAGEKISEDTSVIGKIGDKVAIDKRSIADYTFKEFKADKGVLDEQEKVTITDKPQEVTAVYTENIKEIKVTIHYLEEETSQKIQEPKIMYGKPGEPYDFTTEMIPIDHFSVSNSKPAENISGIFGTEDLDIKVYYTADFGLLSQGLPEKIDFGSHKIDMEENKFTVTDSAMNVGVSDYRFDRKGWKLSVRHNGFNSVGAENVPLEGATFWYYFGPCKNTDGQLPSMTKGDDKIGLIPNTAVTIMNATGTSGTGTNVMEIQRNVLEVPGGVKKVPEKYKTTITWTLSDTPD